HVIIQANRNQDAGIPPGTDRIRFGLRVYAGGQADIHGLVLGHRPLLPAEVFGRAEHLVLTNQYPSYDDLYRNAFVHSRMAAYAERDTRVDVFRLRHGEGLSYHEFHNIDVITGSQEVLHILLNSGRYKSVLVHFLDETMWQVLQHHIDRVKVVVWVHGSEIQPWHRRDNFENEQQRDAAKIQSKARMTFWRGLLRQMPDNLKLVFVSKYLAEVTMEDIGVQLPESRYHVIHNAIDTDLFAYHKKSAKQRNKILSIRPYASRTYANDLSVKAILALSKKPYFNDLEFRMIGDGKLFDEVLEPVRGFKNVYIERRFLTHVEIAAIHREYGIFLCPSRMDTQGVSRDEAMSSGLVPVTNS
ncbi:MAG: methyltransferase type 12, partial [Nitrospiraceae bacterium]